MYVYIKTKLVVIKNVCYKPTIDTFYFLDFNEHINKISVFFFRFNYRNMVI